MQDKLQETQGWIRYLTTNSTATSFNSSVDKTRNITKAVYDALGNKIPVSKNLLVWLRFFGVGDDNDKFDYRVWHITPMYSDPLTRDPSQYLVEYLGTGLVTFGTLTGVTGGTAVASTNRFCDTATWVPASDATTIDGPLDMIETALTQGTSGVFSAAANDLALLVLPAIPRAGELFIDFNCDNSGGTAGEDATSANCLYMVDGV